MSAAEQPGSLQDADSGDIVVVLNLAINRIVSEYFGSRQKKTFYRVLRRGVEGEISRWRQKPDAKTTETLINLFEGRAIDVVDRDTWTGYDGARPLRDVFLASDFQPLLIRLKALKARLDREENEEARRGSLAAWNAVASAKIDDDRSSQLLQQLLDIYPQFLASLDDALGQGGDHALDGRLRVQLHEQPSLLKTAMQLGKTDTALHLLQSLHFAAFDEQPDNPLGEAMRHGAVAPVLRIVDELAGKRATASPHDAPQGNRIPDLLVDLEKEADALASQMLDPAVAYDLAILRQFAQLSQTRAKIDGDRRVNIGDIDRSAWPLRQLYLGSLRRVEDIASQIVGSRLAYAPATAIFRDELSIDRLDLQAAVRLSELQVRGGQYLGPEMVKLAPGTFLMGACSHDAAARDNEKPQHPVVIERPFALSRFLITNSEYLVYAYSEGIENFRSMRTDPTIPRSATPFESWVEYCEWLSRFAGISYRLPSEAEWEYACRAGTSTIYWWGDEPDATKAHVYRADLGPSRPGAFPPNPWRLSDMVGNLGQWCADHYAPNYQEARTQTASATPVEVERLRLGDQTLELSGSFEAHIPVSRGGDFTKNWEAARTSNRRPHQARKSNRWTSIGLRVARDIQ